MSILSDPRNNNFQVQRIHSTTKKPKLSLLSKLLQRITPRFLTNSGTDYSDALVEQTTTGNEPNIQPSSTGTGSKLPTGKAPADPTPPLTAGSKTVHTQERTLTSEEIKNEWPTCAISLNNVLDSPVITPEGNVYNRNDIVQSLNSNNIDPSTRSPLTQSDLKPFRFLSSLIAAIVVEDTKFSDETVTQLENNLKEELHAYFPPSKESITVDSNDHPVFNRLKNKFKPILKSLKNPEVFNQFKEDHIGGWVTNEDGKQIFKYKNDNSYEGLWKNGHPDGQGTMTYANGDTYVGLWENGHPNGQGTMTYANGDTYEGLWKNGHPNGQGTHTWKNGNKYTGEFKDGRSAQDVKIFLSDGEYHGTFKHGLPDGQGTMTYPNGETYEGQWVNGRRHGQGTMTYATGNTYVGQWVNGRRHGQGTMTYPNGDKYEGQWEGGLQHGYGYVTYADNSTYEGEFKNGFRHGQGIRHYNNGDKYEGEFKNNRLHGEGTMTYANGDTCKGLWENGQPPGNGIRIFADDKRSYQGNLKDGHPHGFGTMTYANGKYVGNFENGRRHGHGTQHDWVGSMRFCYVGDWKNDFQHGRGTLTDDRGNCWLMIDGKHYSINPYRS